MTESDVLYTEGWIADPVEPEQIRVLHVDDDPGFLKTTEELLGLQGSFQVESITSVQEALDKLEGGRFDVVVSDYLMPDRTGLDLLRELRGEGSDVPFIVFTGKGKEEVAMEALNLGADRYLQKHGDPETVYVELAHSIRKSVRGRRMERELQMERKRLKGILDNAHDAIVLCDDRGCVVYWNDAAEELFGYSEEEALGEELSDLIIPKRFRDRYRKGFSEFKEKGDGPFIGETVQSSAIRKDGTEVPVELSISKYKLNSKMLVMSTIRNIAPRKEAERALRESEEKYRKQFEGSLDAIVLADAETGEIIDCNRAAAELVNRTREELIGKHQKILHPPEEIEGTFSRTFHRHLKGGDDEILESRVLTKDGEVRDVIIKAATFEAGNNKLIQGTFRDVTLQKEREETLRREREILEKVTQNMGAGLTVISKDFRILWANKLLKDAVGDVEGELCYHAYLRRNQVCPECGVKQIFEEGEEKVIHEQQRGCSHGRNEWVQVTTTPLRDQKGNIVSALELTTYLTDHKKIEEALRKSEKKYRSVFENTGTAMCVVEEDMTLSMINQKFEEVSGYSKEEVECKMKWTEFVTPECLELMKEYHRQRRKKDGYAPKSYALDFINKDGEIRNGLLTIGLVPGTTKSIASIQDITKLKQREEELQASLDELSRMNEKLEVVGKMTRHDVRNKLSTVTNNLYLARINRNTPEVEKYLENAKAAIGECKKIFDFAKAYEQLGTQTLKPVNLEQAVKKIVKQLFSDLKEKKITVENKCNGLTVEADEMLPRLFYNLIRNTLDHGGNNISKIRVYHREAKGNKMKVVYEDDGVGIPKEEKEKIFQEGYGEGTGYGLYLIKKMCEVYGWTIKETGTPSEGAKFTITCQK